MWFAFRIFYSAALSLSLISAVTAQSQSSSSAIHSTRPISAASETAVSGMVTKYFAFYASKNLDGLMSLWSSWSPNREAYKKSASELFASSKEIALKSLTVRELIVEGDKARVRVEVDLQVIEAKTVKEKAGDGKLLRTLEWVHEADGWKVLEDRDTYDEVARELLAAKSDEERAALLKTERSLVTPELSAALGRTSDRLRAEKQYAPALAAAQLALKLAEQVKDRHGQGLAWEWIGRVYGAQRDYRRGLEHYQRALALFEELSDKRIASGLLGRIATSYSYLENYQAALNTNLKRLKLKEELNDREWIASTLDDLTSNYYQSPYNT